MDHGMTDMKTLSRVPNMQYIYSTHKLPSYDYTYLERTAKRRLAERAAGACSANACVKVMYCLFNVLATMHNQRSEMNRNKMLSHQSRGPDNARLIPAQERSNAGSFECPIDFPKSFIVPYIDLLGYI